jgi:Flp pilus assembly protein TadD
MGILKRHIMRVIFLFMIKKLMLAGLLLCSSWVGGQQMTIPECRAVLSNCPDCTRVAVLLGCLYARDGDLTNAERIFQKVLKIDRTSAGAYYNLGVLKLNAGKYDEATDYFIRATIFETNNAQSYINLGNIYNLRNDLNLALFYYQKAFAIDRTDPDLLNDLGVVALKQKSFTDALDYLSRSYALKQDEDIKLNLAVVWHGLGKPEKIRELYPNLTQENRNYSYILQLLEGH